MALTAELPSPDRAAGSQVIPSEPAVKSPIAEGFGAIGDFVKLAGERVRNLRTAQEFANVQSDRAGEVAGASALIQSDKAVLSPPVQTGIDNLNQTRQAVDQGRAPYTAQTIQLTNFLDELRTRHPTELPAALKTLGEHGFKDPAIQQQELQIEANRSAQAQTLALQQKVKEEAVASGVSPDDPNILSIGSDLLGKKYKMEMADKAAQLAKSQAETANITGEAGARINSKAQLDQANALGSYADSVIGQHLERVHQYISGISDNKELTDVETQIGPQITNTIESYRARVLAIAAKKGITDPGAIKYINDQFDQYNENFNKVFTGNAKAASDALGVMSRDLNVQAMDIMPTYMVMKDALGPTGALQLIQSPISFGLPGSDKITAALKTELANIATVSANNPNSAYSHMMMYKDIASGRVDPADIPNASLPGQIQLHSNQVIANARAFLSGDQTVVPAFLKNLDTLSYGAQGLTPGTKDMRTIKAASDAMFTPDNVQALINATKLPGADTSTSVMGFRTAAANLFKVSSALNATDPTGVFSIKLSGDGTRYEISTDRSKLGQANPGGGRGTAGHVTNVQPPGDMVSQVNLMNQALYALGNPYLALADPTMKITGTVTRRDLVNHYTNLSPLPGQIQNGTPGVDRSKLLGQLGEEVRGLNLQLDKEPGLQVPTEQDKAIQANKAQFKPMVESKAEQYGVPRAFALAHFESENANYDPLAHPDRKLFPKSHALGAGQLQPGTARLYGLHVEDNGWDEGKFDERTDYAKNIDASMRYLADLAKKHANGREPTTFDWIAASNEYKGGTLDAKTHRKLLESLE